MRKDAAKVSVLFAHELGAFLYILDLVSERQLEVEGQVLLNSSQHEVQYSGIISNSAQDVRLSSVFWALFDIIPKCFALADIDIRDVKEK